MQKDNLTGNHRMKTLIIAFMATLAALPVAAQNRQALLDSIEKNNTTLAALRQKAVAGKAENRTGLSLEDPNVDFAYLWGSPGGTPPRTNIGVSQPLDWGTISGRRRRVMRTADARIDSEYALQRQTILAEADQAIVQYTYWNKLSREMDRQTSLARQIQELYTKKYETGDIDLMTYRKMKLNCSMTMAEAERIDNEKNTARMELMRLNGGHTVPYHDTLYHSSPLPPLNDFLQQVQDKHPQLRASKAAIAENKEQLKLDRTLSLPSLSVGFMGEYVKPGGYSGLSLGMSLPLWGNSRKKVKQSRAALVAAELDHKDCSSQLFDTVRQRYTAGTSLKNTVEKLQNELEAADNSALLRKALEAGRLSLMDYLNEMFFYTTARMKFYEVERDYHLVLSELNMMLY